jgi:hypothetical protein
VNVKDQLNSETTNNSHGTWYGMQLWRHHHELKL